MDSKLLVLLGFVLLVATFFVYAEEPLKVNWSTGGTSPAPPSSTAISIPFPGFEVDPVDKICKACSTILQCLACVDQKLARDLSKKKN